MGTLGSRDRAASRAGARARVGMADLLRGGDSPEESHRRAISRSPGREVDIEVDALLWILVAVGDRGTFEHVGSGPVGFA